jgi:diguanylate cyclase (GGDEF)-like protein/PAS domain S-box-containing protein
VHKLFARQLAKATKPSGEIDLGALGELVVSAYEQADRDRRRTDRSISLMIEELDQLNRGLERLVAERTAALREREAQLQARNLQFDAALNNMTQGLTMFDTAGRLVVCNARYLQMYGLSPDIIKLGCTVRDLVHQRIAAGTFFSVDPEKYIADLTAAMTKKNPISTTMDLTDGRVITVISQPIAEGGGWLVTHEDITEQRRAEQELGETKRFLDSIIANIPIAVVVKDAKTRKFILVNRAFATMLDLSQNDLLGKTVFDIYGNKAAERLDSADNETLRSSNGVNYSEYEVEMPMRGMRIHATNRIVIRNDQGDAKYLVAVIDDVTERKKSEQRIAFMAHHDALTGLANRAAVAQKIEDAAARHRRWGDPFTVLLMDLDRFKNVNDTLGHPAGDALLQEAARRLKTFLRETDALARLGGDEFAIIQGGETNQREAASTLADRIIELIAKPFNIDGNEVNIGTSIGIALAPEHGTNPDSLLKMADMALYGAKSAGRNGYRFFDPEMGNAANARLALENELRHAIQQDQLELHYQPIIDTKTRRICAAEALVRWRHPTKGMIFPDKFIPLAEETGVIAQIGEWVLRTACSDGVTWPVNVRVAVNLSPAQFRKAKISDIVLNALAESGLPPERLELEITETVLIESAAECLPALRQFKNLGITIALDDFGTGYSSLSQLAMFPFDRIKIDKSFTQNLTKRTECAAIISATLTLAQLLDIATTAEGVETADQCRLLRLAGVTSMQGYLFKHPCPISEIDFDGTYDGPAIADAA